MTVFQKDIDLFLEHHGVKGMHWGVRKERRATERVARRERFKSGTPTLKDKLIRDLDFDRSRSERRTDLKVASGKQVGITLAAAGAAFILARKVTMNTPMAAIVGATTGAATATMLQGKSTGVPVREKRLRSAPTKTHSDAEVNAAVAKFVKNNPRG